MKLSYRGNSYETESSLLEVKETEVKGKYRGQNWKYKLPQHIPQLQPKLYLQYRGIAYSTCPNAKVPTESIKYCCIPVKQKCPRVVVKNTEQVHLENLRRNLERRLEVAKAGGNQDLVNLLQKEYQQLVRS
jgi:hypothetical protein